MLMSGGNKSSRKTKTNSRATGGKKQMKLLKSTAVVVDPTGVVYVPIGISGYPHCFCTVAEAKKAGAFNIKVSYYEGTPTPWAGMVADWPPSLFA